MQIAIEIDGKPFRYAQEKAGQKLHLAEVIYDHGWCFSARTRCGRQVKSYRATFNVPMGHACKNCMRTMK